MLKLGVLFALTAMLSQVQSHSLHLGPCPPVSTMDGFVLEEFMGNWYIIQVYNSINICMTMNFTMRDNNTVKVDQTREFVALDVVGLKHKNTYTGTIKVNYATDPPTMTISWPLNLLNVLGRETTFRVVDTDNEIYALIHECTSVWAASKQSFAILSRTPELDPAVITKLRNEIDAVGGELDHLTIVNQTNCLQDDEGNFNNIGINEIAGNTLSEEEIEVLKTNKFETEEEMFAALTKAKTTPKAKPLLKDSAKPEKAAHETKDGQSESHAEEETQPEA